MIIALCFDVDHGSLQLETIYATTANEKRIEIEKVKEEMKVIDERLDANRSTKKLKIF